jgi:hypothetical protein
VHPPNPIKLYCFLSRNNRYEGLREDREDLTKGDNDNNTVQPRRN